MDITALCSWKKTPNVISLQLVYVSMVQISTGICFTTAYVGEKIENTIKPESSKVGQGNMIRLNAKSLQLFPTNHDDK